MFTFECDFKRLVERYIDWFCGIPQVEQLSIWYGCTIDRQLKRNQKYGFWYEHGLTVLKYLNAFMTVQQNLNKYMPLREQLKAIKRRKCFL